MASGVLRCSLDLMRSRLPLNVISTRRADFPATAPPASFRSSLRFSLQRAALALEVGYDRRISSSVRRLP